MTRKDALRLCSLEKMAFIMANLMLLFSFFYFSCCSTLDGGVQSLHVVARLLRNKVYAELVDFDSHLDDISLDWMNPSVNSLIDLTSR